MTQTFNHKSVLLEAAIQGLNIQPNGTYVDCTLGGGGHTKEILKALSTEGCVYAFDQDITAINHAKEVFAKEIEANRLVLIHKNFRYLEEELNRHGVTRVDGILYDLGVSSPQLDEIERGFSYRQNAPLDMRMNQQQTLTAETIVNEWSYNELVRIFFRYGEEKFSKQIARQIEKERENKRITTTEELVAIIKDSIPAPARRKGGHPAKRVFQAIRIAVNDELGAIESSIEQALKILQINGRISAISFQSLEDRIIKQMFKDMTTEKDLPKKLPVIAEVTLPSYQLINRKPNVATEEEIAFNSRAKSAKLRVIERTRE